MDTVEASSYIALVIYIAVIGYCLGQLSDAVNALRAINAEIRGARQESEAHRRHIREAMNASRRRAEERAHRRARLDPEETVLTSNPLRRDKP